MSDLEAREQPGSDSAVRFAARCRWNADETAWAIALRQRRRAGLPLFELTASNPTRCGFEYDAHTLLTALASPRALDYDPDPRGGKAAREAVSDYYRDLGAQTSPDRIFLTTGTSEAYSFLFRLLCDPGDEILIASPSYPLFDFLADIDDVRLRPYPLFYDHGWHLDSHGLRERITSRTRAIAVVHPNNPTGHFVKPAERRELEAICAEHALALIVDEVFLDYSLGRGDQPQSFASGEHPVLTFVLSGVSKVCGLPQMKAAWIVCSGPGSHLKPAMDKLEIIADTFLSMNAPVQCALPIWLQHRRLIQGQIVRRIGRNLKVLDEELAEFGTVTRLALEAGWYAVLRVPALQPDEELALRLLQDHSVAVHPGSFFGFPGAGWLVISLLAPPAEFAQGVRACLAGSSSGQAA